MSFQRLIIALLITIGLLSSTSGAAFSQGRMAGAETITICSPDGVHNIILGANGDPVPSAHEYHDCCFASLDVQEHSNFSNFVLQNFTRISLPVITIAWASRSTSSANARAPPYVV